MRFLLLATLLFAPWVAAQEGKPNPNHAVAIFAGGCFWCMEPPYDQLEGVKETLSGYTGGHLDNPSYEQVTRENTGHYEAVKITYDPDQISFSTLLQVFWRNIDPLDAGGQFCDRGSSYRSAIFYLDEAQRQLAETSKQQVAKHVEQEVVTELLPAKKFYPAEDYHQNYYQKNPLRYKFYRHRCGRDARLEELWGNLEGSSGQ